MLTDHLRRVVEQLAELPSEEQDALAALIEADLTEDRRWQAALDEAREQVARGEDRDLGELL